ncbi:MAG: copper resistance protein B [Sphingosinicella sp.]|uniref:copper resistance protein B n=1 Tax=Sphingosinicella sp. TaxID=1917971 RepID=UPI0040380E88
MKRLTIALLALSVSAPALAQHQGHGGHRPTTTQPRPQRTSPPAPPRRATPAPRRRAAPAPARPRTAPARPAPARPAPAADPHAGHATPPPVGPAPAADPHAGHAMPQPDPHAGHAAPTAADPHAGHDMGQMPMPVADPPARPPPPEATRGPVHAADTVFPLDRTSRARDTFLAEHGRIRTFAVMIDRLEASIQGGRDGYAWDAQAWYGGAIDRLWLKSEGEGAFGEVPEQAELQVLWSRALDPWFNLQAGVRHDFRPDPERSYFVLGIEGLAPYWFEVDGALFLSNKGDLSARFEGEYDLRITQQLILQPRLELDFALQDVPEIGVGSGLSSGEAGLRLRYEIVPEFAPYVGVQYGRAFGDTARFRRLAGEDIGGWSLLVGVRAWF